MAIERKTKVMIMSKGNSKENALTFNGEELQLAPVCQHI